MASLFDGLLTPLGMEMGLLDVFRRTPSQDQFARDLIRRFKDAGDTRTATYHAERFTIEFSADGESGGTASLTNVYAEHCRVAKSDREQHLSQLVRGFLSHLYEPPEELEDARPDILPMLRGRDYFGHIALAQRFEDEPAELPYQVVSDLLALGPVFDLPAGVTTLPQDQLDKWGISLFEALEIAKANLQELKCAAATVGEGTYIFANGDSYDATRMILTDLITSLEVQGQRLALPANRDVLLVTGTDDEAGMEQLLEVGEKALDEPRPITGVPHVLTDGHWEPWSPDPSHPLFNRFKLLAAQSHMGVYAGIKQVLDQQHEDRDIDIFVATLSGLQSEDGEASTYCVWTEGVESYLPVADQVAFVRPAGEDNAEIIGMADWADVVREVGNLMEPLDFSPSYFHVREFPTDEQLERLISDPIE